MNRLLVAAVMTAAALPLFGVGAQSETIRDSLDRGVLYIQTTQQADGGFGGFGPGQTMDAIYAIRAAGYDPNEFVTHGNSPADYLEANAAGATTAASAGKAALAALALDLDARSVGGVDLVAVIEGAFDAGTGRYAGDDFSHPIAMIALAATGEAVPAAAVDALRASQVGDGGWGFGSSDPDTTAIAMQGMAAASVAASDPDMVEAMAYLATNQLADGGWGFGESNASSTAYVVQALLAVGEDPGSAAWTKPGGSPLGYLLSQQTSDGSFAGFDPAFATNQALPAIAGRTFQNAPGAPVTEELPQPEPTVAAPGATATPKAPAVGAGSADRGDVAWPGAIALGLVAVGAGAAIFGLRRR